MATKWKFRFKKDKLRATFERGEKRHTHDYDVSDLADYVDEQSPDLIQDLINEGNIKSRINVLTNVKGSQKLKLIKSTPTLQSAADCGWTPEDGMILTDKTISTVRVKIQEEYCNEDLNETWAQMENAVGANSQDETPPSFADAMLLYYQMRAQELDEELIVNGDTASMDENLAHYNGYAKLWTADPLLNVAEYASTTITDSNGYDVLKAVFDEMPTTVKRHKNAIKAEIICGYETARHAIEQRDADKEVSDIVFTEENGEITFILPTTNMTVRSIPQLDGTSKVFGVCWGYMFYATDLQNDEDGFSWNYNTNTEKLNFGVKWRAGIQYVHSQYFTRLRLTRTS